MNSFVFDKLNKMLTQGRGGGTANGGGGTTATPPPAEVQRPFAPGQPIQISAADIERLTPILKHLNAVTQQVKAESSTSRSSKGRKSSSHRSTNSNKKRMDSNVSSAPPSEAADSSSAPLEADSTDVADITDAATTETTSASSPPSVEEVGDKLPKAGRRNVKAHVHSASEEEEAPSSLAEVASSSPSRPSKKHLPSVRLAKNNEQQTSSSSDEDVEVKPLLSSNKKEEGEDGSFLASAAGLLGFSPPNDGDSIVAPRKLQPLPSKVGQTPKKRPATTPTTKKRRRTAAQRAVEYARSSAARQLESSASDDEEEDDDYYDADESDEENSESSSEEDDGNTRRSHRSSKTSKQKSPKQSSWCCCCKSKWSACKVILYILLAVIAIVAVLWIFEKLAELVCWGGGLIGFNLCFLPIHSRYITVSSTSTTTQSPPIILNNVPAAPPVLSERIVVAGAAANTAWYTTASNWLPSWLPFVSSSKEVTVTTASVSAVPTGASTSSPIAGGGCVCPKAAIHPTCPPNANVHQYFSSLVAWYESGDIGRNHIAKSRANEVCFRLLNKDPTRFQHITLLRSLMLDYDTCSFSTLEEFIAKVGQNVAPFHRDWAEEFALTVQQYLNEQA